MDQLQGSTGGEGDPDNTILGKDMRLIFAFFPHNLKQIGIWKWLSNSTNVESHETHTHTCTCVCVCAFVYVHINMYGYLYPDAQTQTFWSGISWYGPKKCVCVFLFVVAIALRLILMISQFLQLSIQQVFKCVPRSPKYVSICGDICGIIYLVLW